MTWILVTLIAAGLQTLRFMVQKKLRMETLSSGGATFARFVYAGPLIVAVAGWYLFQVETGLPDLSKRFWALAVIGGIAQICATMCLVSLFQLRNFTVGITFIKTEVLLTAIVGAIILGEWVTWWAILAILIGVAGAIVLALPSPQGTKNTSKLIDARSITLGVGGGFLFAICSVAYRGATLEISSTDVLVRSLTTLMMVIILQTFFMSLYLWRREPGQITQVLHAWRQAVWVGILSLGGSIGWFTAFAMQNAAYVKAVGQIEIVFSLAVTTLVFGERITVKEGVGITLLVLSVLALILAV